MEKALWIKKRKIVKLLSKYWPYKLLQVLVALVYLHMASIRPVFPILFTFGGRVLMLPPPVWPSDENTSYIKNVEGMNTFRFFVCDKNTNNHIHIKWRRNGSHSGTFEKQKPDWTSLASCDSSFVSAQQTFYKASDLQAAGYFQHAGLHSCVCMCVGGWGWQGNNLSLLVEGRKVFFYYCGSI